MDALVDRVDTRSRFTQGSERASCGVESFVDILAVFGDSEGWEVRLYCHIENEGSHLYNYRSKVLSCEPPWAVFFSQSL